MSSLVDVAVRLVDVVYNVFVGAFVLSLIVAFGFGVMMQRRRK